MPFCEKLQFIRESIPKLFWLSQAIPLLQKIQLSGLKIKDLKTKQSSLEEIFVNLVKEIADIPAISVNPGLENSQYSGLKAFSEGFAKEGVGAGGTIISSMIKTGNDSTKFLEITEKEYHRLFTSQWQILLNF